MTTHECLCRTIVSMPCCAGVNSLVHCFEVIDVVRWVSRAPEYASQANTHRSQPISWHLILAVLPRKVLQCLLHRLYVPCCKGSINA